MWGFVAALAVRVVLKARIEQRRRELLPASAERPSVGAVLWPQHERDSIPPESELRRARRKLEDDYVAREAARIELPTSTAERAARMLHESVRGLKIRLRKYITYGSRVFVFFSPVIKYCENSFA